MPTFAELREKAAKASESASTKVTDIKDRHSSVPMAKTNWDPYDKSKKPPPPPPPGRGMPPALKAKPAPPPPPVRGRPQSVAVESPDLSPAPSPVPAPSLAPRPPPLVNQSSRPDQTPSPAPPPIRAPAPVLSRRAPSPASELSIPIVATPDEWIEDGDEPQTSEDIQIDWRNLAPEDKAEFFDWLDEFFARFLGKSVAEIRAK